jgi:hypothetical protein
MVGVAQLVEPLTVTQVVEGSSPFIHPILRLFFPLNMPSHFTVLVFKLKFGVIFLTGPYFAI